MVKPIGAVTVQDRTNVMTSSQNEYVIANHVSVVRETMFQISSNTRT